MLLRRLWWWCLSRNSLIDRLRHRHLAARAAQAESAARARQCAKVGREVKALTDRVATQERQYIETIDALRDHATTLQAEIETLNAKLQVRETAIEELHAVIGRLHAYQERDTQIAMAQAVAATQGLKRAGNRYVPTDGS